MNFDKTIKPLYKRYPYFFNLIIVQLVLTIIQVFDFIAWIQPYDGKIRNILLGQTFEFISYLSIIPFFIYFNLLLIKKKQTLFLVLFIITFSIIAPIIIKLLARFLEITFWTKDIAPITLDSLKKNTPLGVIFLFPLTITFYLTRMRFQFIHQREATYKAETLAKDLQLRMLRYQINPHFLFNVLNSIHALIDENKEKAKKLVVEMAEYYRYTLNKQLQTSSIEKEIEAVRKYLEIQKIRFEEKFEFEICSDELSNSVEIPSFIIHLLVENAVKYGIKSIEDKLIINLDCAISDNTLFICVSNTGKLILSEKNGNGTGNGIENIKNRLSIFYNDRSEFSLVEKYGWVIATIKIKQITML